MQPRILMCPPDHYGIEYEINPWMNRSLGAVRALAFRQWQHLHDTLVVARRSGRDDDPAARACPTSSSPPTPGLCSTPRSSAAGSGTRSAPRSRRTSTRGSRDHGFTVEHLPENMFHEGAGDALFCGETLFAGYRTRSDAAAHQWVGEKLGVRVLPLELVNPRFYHLDTCFCPLAPGEAIYFPDAFDAYGQRVLKTHVPKLIAVNEAEAHRFGCNAVVVGKTVVHNSRCPRTGREPRAGGLPVDRGGAGRVPQGRRQREVPDAALDGEEAAGWKQ